MIRIGVDFGGTKIEAAALGSDGAFLARVRAPNPGDYDAAVLAVRQEQVLPVDQDHRVLRPPPVVLGLGNF